MTPGKQNLMTMEAIAENGPLRAVRPCAASGLSYAVFDSLESAESTWRSFEAQGVLTPYQRFDWVRNYCAAGFDKRPGEIAIIGIADGATPLALLPLRIVPRFGLRIARIIGTPISNSDSLIYTPARRHQLTPAVLRRAFAALAEAGHAADIVSFDDLLPEWKGQPNPLLAFSHARAPNHLYTGRLDGPVEQGIDRKHRSNLKRGIRRLEERFGPVRLRQARTPDEIDAFEEVFFQQRSRRFREMGVRNVFGTPEFRRFFRQTARDSLGERRPALRIHALFTGETIVTTSFGAYCGDHYTQQINSTAAGEAAKYSLTGITLMLLLEELRSEGITSFDLGLGDFDYKNDWTAPVVVYDSIVPVTPRGRIGAPVVGAVRRIKRVVKQTPVLWRIARGVLAVHARLGAAADRKDGPAGGPERP